MTKPITKERLLQTLENISAWHQRINGHNCDVMHVLCSAGMKSAFDEALGRHDPLAAVKTDLELTVLEVQKSPTALMALRQEWKYNINRKRAKEDRVFKIQEAAAEHATLTSKDGASHRVSLLAQYRDYSGTDGPPEPGYRLSEYRMEDGKVTGIRESDWVVDSVQIYRPEVPEGAYCFEFVVCLCSHQPHEKEWSDAPFATDDHPVGTYDQAHEEFLRTMGLRPDQFPYVRTWFR